ncbi:MAG: glycosyltransferase family 4 protein [Anaerolineae bacterium]|nr:glycosyltransferase family 4 protein [Anaerolineae bacterium]
MRVLMLSKACVVGTYQRKLEEIAKLPDVELRVLVPPSWKDARGVLALERAHTEGYDLRATPIRLNGNFHLHYYPQIAQEIRAFQPDIMHIDEEPYNLATWHALYHTRRASKRAAQPIKTLFFSWQNINRRYPLPVHRGEQWVLHHVDYAIMGTQSAAGVWRAKGYAGPAAVIPQFGVDPTIFAPPEKSRNEDQPFTIGFVGRLVEEKGGLILLDALHRLNTNERWQLAIIGDGPHKTVLQHTAAQLGIADRITFDTLPSAEMPAFYQRLAALAIPSLTRPNWKEQFGRVIVEAMACGVPVIGSDSGAIPDVIGDAGLIAPEGDSAALAAHLRDLMDQPHLRRDLAVRGRQRVLDQFTQAQVATQHVAVYRALLDQ